MRMLRTDARIPLRFGASDTQAAGEALLVDADIRGLTPRLQTLQAGESIHPVGCGCCCRRSPEADALARLFRRRATGEEAWFNGVLAVVSPARQAGVTAALRDDPLVSARFRLVDRGA